jgi:hypothetical protein
MRPRGSPNGDDGREVGCIKLSTDPLFLEDFQASHRPRDMSRAHYCLDHPAYNQNCGRRVTVVRICLVPVPPDRVPRSDGASITADGQAE